MVHLCEVPLFFHSDKLSYKDYFTCPLTLESSSEGLRFCREILLCFLLLLLLQSLGTEFPQQVLFITWQNVKIIQIMYTLEDNCSLMKDKTELNLA